MSKNIQVAIKVRPLLRKEKDQQCPSKWRVVNNSIQLIDSEPPYYFDHIFDQDMDNQIIFDKMAKHIVHSAVHGFNGTIFAYGQTSSGKTYTMMGDDNNPGVMVLAAKEIFKEMERTTDREFLLRVGYIEIYNEKIYDLLNKKNQDLKIHETTTGMVSVNSEESIIMGEEELLRHLRSGNDVRTVGETNMNERSSRSHAIFRIIIESRKLDRSGDDAISLSVLNLVDLAGSERADQTGARGTRLKEGGHINKSLLFLSNVIKRLSENEDDKYISYRDSKLTRILQASLGGNALTSIICTIKPTAVEETQSTLSFALRAKTIKNKPHVNETVSDATMMKRLEREIKDLKTRLEEERSKNESQLKVNQLEQRIKNEVLKLITSNSLHNIRTQKEKRRRTWCSATSSFDPLPYSGLPVPTALPKPSLLHAPKPSMYFTPQITVRPAQESTCKTEQLSVVIESYKSEQEEEFKPAEEHNFDRLSPQHLFNLQQWDACKTPNSKNLRTISITPNATINLESIEGPYLELQQYTNLENKLDVQHDIYAALKEKLEHLSTRNGILERERLEFSFAKDEYSVVKLNLSDCEKRCADLQSQLNDLKTINQNLEVQNREAVSLEFEFQRHRNKSKLRETELLDLLAEKDKEILMLKRSVSHGEATLNEVRNEMRQLQDKHEKLEGTWRGQEQTIVEIQAEYDDIQSKYKVLQGEYEMLEQTSVQSQEVCMRLQNENTNLEVQINELKIRVEETQKSLLVWHSQPGTADADNDVKSLKQKNEKLAIELDDVKRQYEDMQREYDDLSNQLMDNLQEGETLRDEYNKLKAKLKDNEEALIVVPAADQLDSIKKTFEDEIQNLRIQLNTLVKESQIQKSASSECTSMLSYDELERDSESMKSSGVCVDDDNDPNNGSKLLDQFAQLTEYLQEIEFEHISGKGFIFKAKNRPVNFSESFNKLLVKLRNIKGVNSLVEDEDNMTGEICMKGILEHCTFQIVKLEPNTTFDLDEDSIEVNDSKNLNEAIAQLKQQIQELTLNNEYLSAENRTLLESSERSIEEMREQITKLSAELFEKSMFVEKCACDDYQKQIEYLEKERAEMSMVCDELQGKIKDSTCDSAEKEANETLCNSDCSMDKSLEIDQLETVDFKLQMIPELKVPVEVSDINVYSKVEKEMLLATISELKTQLALHVESNETEFQVAELKSKLALQDEEAAQEIERIKKIEAELLTTVANLKSQISTLTAVEEGLQATIAELQSKQEHQVQATQEIDRLQSKESELLTTVADLQSKLEEQIAFTVELQTTIADLRSKEEQQFEATQEIDRLQSKEADLQKTVADLKSQLEEQITLKEELQATIADLKSKKNTQIEETQEILCLQSKEAELFATVADLKSQLSAQMELEVELQATIADLKTEQELKFKATQEIDHSQSKEADLLKTVADLQSQLAKQMGFEIELQTTIADLKTKQNTQVEETPEILCLQSKEAEFLTTIADLKSQLAKQMTDLKTEQELQVKLQATIADLKSKQNAQIAATHEIHCLQTKEAELLATVADLKSQLAVQMAELISEQELQLELQATIADLRSKQDLQVKTTQEIERLQFKEAELLTTVSDLKSQLAVQMADLKSKQELQLELQDTIADLISKQDLQVETTQEIVEHLQSKEAELSTTIADLKSQLSAQMSLNVQLQANIANLTLQQERQIDHEIDRLQIKESELLTTVAELKSQLASQREKCLEYDSLKVLEVELNSDVQSKTNLIQQLQAQCSELDKLYKDAQLSLSRMQEEQDIKFSELLATFENKERNYKEENNRLQLEYYQKLELSENESRENLRKYNREWEESKENFENTIANLRKELENKLDSIDEYKQTTDATLKEFIKKDTNREEIIKSLQEQLQTFDSLLEENTKLKESTELLKSEYKKSLLELQLEKQNLQLCIDKHNADKTTVQDKEDNLRLKIDSLELQLIEAKKKSVQFDNLIVEYAEVEKLLSTVNQAKVELSHKLQNVEEQCQSAQLGRDNAVLQQQFLQSQLESLQDQIVNEHSAIQHQIKDFQSSLAEQKLKCEALTEANVKLQKSNDCLDQQLQVATKKAADCESLRAELENLNIKYNDLQNYMEVTVEEAGKCSKLLQKDIDHHKALLEQQAIDYNKLRTLLDTKESTFKDNKLKLEATVSCLLAEKKAIEEKLYVTEMTLKNLNIELAHKRSDSANNSLESITSTSPSGPRKSLDRAAAENTQLKLKVAQTEERKNRRLSTHDENRRQSYWGATRNVGSMTEPWDKNCKCVELDTKLKECEMNLFIRGSQVTALNMELKNHPLKTENAALIKRLQEEQNKCRNEVKKYKQQLIDQKLKTENALIAASAAKAKQTNALKVKEEVHDSRLCATTQTESDLETDMQNLLSKYNDIKLICRQRHLIIRELEEKVAQKENNSGNVPSTALEAGQVNALKNQSEELKKELNIYKHKYNNAKLVLHSRREEIQKLRDRLGES